MRKETLPLLLLLSLFVTWTMSRSSEAQSGAASTDKKRVLEGAINVSSMPEPGSNVKWGRAEGLVNAPFDQVMNIVQDYGSYANFLPHFRVSRVLAQQGANAIVYLEAEILKKTYKIWTQQRFRSRPSHGKTRIIEGKMTKGNVDSLKARWEITPMDSGQTKVVFQMHFDPSFPFPSSVISDQNVTAARRTIRALRKKVQQLKKR